MKKLIKFSSSLMFLFSLQGCSSLTPKEMNTMDHHHSTAYNILKAGNIDDLSEIKEPKIQYEEYVKAENRLNDVIATSNLVAWTGLGVMQNIGGNFYSSLNAGLGMGFLSSLTVRTPALQRMRLVFWMPKHMAKNEEEVKKKMNKIIRDAYSPLWKQYPHEFKDEKTLIGSYNYKLYFKAPWCENISKCSASRKGRTLSLKVIENKVPPFVDINPKYDAWVGSTSWGVERYAPYCDGRKFSPKNRKKCIEHNASLYPTLIKNLPEWVFVYYKGVVYQGGYKNAYPIGVSKKTN